MMTDPGNSRPGAVVLHIRSGTANPLAVEAATRFARSMRAEFESLFVEDDALLSLAELPIAREISPTGRRRRTLSAEQIHRSMRARARTVRQDIERSARAARLECRFSAIRDTADAAISRASARARILVFGEPVGGEPHTRAPALSRCFGEVEGCIMVGSRVRRTAGPVVIVLDRIGALAGMGELADHWTADRAEEFLVIPLGIAPEDRARLASSIRHVFAADKVVRVQPIDEAEPERAVADVVFRARAGLTIMRQQGPLASDDARLARLVAALECPLLLHHGD